MKAPGSICCSLRDGSIRVWCGGGGYLGREEVVLAPGAAGKRRAAMMKPFWSGRSHDGGGEARDQ